MTPFTTSASCCCSAPNASTTPAGRAPARRPRCRRPDDALSGTWAGREKVRDVYLTDDVDEATHRLDDAIAWCSARESGPELWTLAKTLRRWRAPDSRPRPPHHRRIKRSGRGFRNVHNYWLRITRAGGARERCQTLAGHEQTRRPTLLRRAKRWNPSTVGARLAQGSGRPSYSCNILVLRQRLLAAMTPPS